MTARTTMARLIQEVRNLTAADHAEYTIGTATYWDDAQVQTMLDRHRRDVNRAPLEAVYAWASGGSIQYQEYRACFGEWEATDGGSAIFQVEDSTGANAGTAAWSADYARGIVTFAADQRGTAYYVTGRVFDLYGAAAELLRAWAAREKLAFDFSSDQQSFKRSQKAQTLLQMAVEYEGKAWTRSAPMRRGDLADWGGY